MRGGVVLRGDLFDHPLRLHPDPTAAGPEGRGAEEEEGLIQPPMLASIYRLSIVDSF